MAGLKVTPIVSLNLWSQVLDLRHTVFVKGQNVPEAMEVDRADLTALHVVATVEGRVVGTGRVVIETDGSFDIPEHAAEDDAVTRELARKKLPRYQPSASQPLRGRVGRMAVLDSERQKGIGRLLLGALEGLAFRAGAKRVILMSQESAIGFYEKQHYVSEGAPLMEAGIRHIWMVKAKQ